MLDNNSHVEYNVLRGLIIWENKMLLFLKTYWKAIAIVLLLVLTNIATYQRTSLHVNTQWELKWSEANVDALKSTIEEQKKEIDKQKELLTQQEKQNEIDKQKQITLINDSNELDNRNRMLQQKLRELSRNQESGNPSAIATRANAATDRLLQTLMLQESIQRNVEVGKYADKLRAVVESCNDQYNNVREVLNGRRK
jgi:septal ring factor EnvC (AmiA/AmiB activator)